jgi:transposase
MSSPSGRRFYEDFREAGASVLKSLWEAIEILLTNAQAARQVRADMDLPTLKAVLSGACVSLDLADGNKGLKERIWSVFRDGLRCV